MWTTGRRARGAPHKRTLERRLFLWLLGVALVPALLLIAAAWWVGTGSLGWFGSLGAWEPVGTTGRELFDAVAPAVPGDTVLASAVERHRDALTISLTQAQRWSYLGGRITALLPWLLLGSLLLTVLLAVLVARRLAGSLLRPLAELVDWSERLGRSAPLPAATPAEAGDPAEIAALRVALRDAATQIAAGRRRALEAERLRAWGELARRVAHEMKNPLTPMRLAAHRLRRLTASVPAAVEPLAVIDEETARLEELAREFAAIGRPAEGAASEIDIVELCGMLLDKDVPPAIRTRLDADPAVPRIMGHYELLLRALRNVVRNAVESIEARSGTGVTALQPVAAAGARADAAAAASAVGTIAVRIEAHVDGVRVTVADDGVGLPPGAPSRIFEPDMTTKRGGAGLGLALARQAAVAHGGGISAAPRPGGGAEFVFELAPAPGPSGAAPAVAIIQRT